MITLGFKQSEVKPTRRTQPKLDLFLSMCQSVGAFMAKHGGGNFNAFLSRADGSAFCLYLMTDAEAYDFDLSGKLATFAAPFIERGLLESASLLPASSPEELSALFDLDSALRIEIEHAQFSRAPSQVSGEQAAARYRE